MFLVLSGAFLCLHGKKIDSLLFHCKKSRDLATKGGQTADVYSLRPFFIFYDEYIYG
jgi:hypothetical protein